MRNLNGRVDKKKKNSTPGIASVSSRRYSTACAVRFDKSLAAILTFCPVRPVTSVC